MLNKSFHACIISYSSFVWLGLFVKVFRICFVTGVHGLTMCAIVVFLL